MRFSRRHRKTPDSVLSKCRDMIALGDLEDAWATFADFLSSKQRRGWSDAHHSLMLEFVGLSVQLRKNPKDGFIQYRLICSTTHLDSLKKCLSDLIHGAEEKGTEQYQALKEEYKDMDENDTATKKEFKEKQFSLPYLKYQWSVYRAVLDVLRNNQKLDPLYQDTVRRCIQFCLNYERTTEFRRLCEVCRKHLKAILEYQHQPNKVEIHTATMLGIYLNTRFELLENATKLHMWEQAFKLIDDIHKLKEKSKTTLDPALETNYYKKLSQIFLESDDMLLHAYSILKYYSLSRDLAEQEESESASKKKKVEDGIYAKRLNKEELDQLGKACVLATLASPIPRTRSQVMGPPMTAKDKKNKTMAEKLNFFLRPNRNHLMEQLYFEDLLDIHDDFKMLKSLLIDEFSPITLCSDVRSILKRIKEHNPDIMKFDKYETAIEKATVRKLIFSVSRMYSSIDMHRLKKMFFVGWTERQIEEMIINMVEERFVWCRMSHSQKMLHFRAPDRLERNSFMQGYLSNLAHSLNTLYDKEIARRHTSRQDLYKDIRTGTENDAEAIKQRGQKIRQLMLRAEHKMKLIKSIDKKKKAMNKKTALAAVRNATEKLVANRIAQNEEKIKQEQKSKEITESLKKAQKIMGLVAKTMPKAERGSRKKAKEQGSVKKEFIKMVTKFDETKSKEAEVFDSKAVESQTTKYLQSVKDARERKRQEELKVHDYMIRACRQKEIPLLHKKYRKQAEKNRVEMESKYAADVARLQSAHKGMLKKKKAYKMCSSQVKWFESEVMQRQREQFTQSHDMWKEAKEKHDAKQSKARKERRAKKQQQQEMVMKKRVHVDEEEKGDPSRAPAAPVEEEDTRPFTKVGPRRGAQPRAPPQAAQPEPRPEPPARTRPGFGDPRDPPTRQEEEPRPRQPLRPAADPEPDRSEAGQWRRPAPRTAPGDEPPATFRRRRFYNSTKKAQEEAGSPQPREEQPPLRPQGIRPVAGTQGSLRPQPGGLRPQGRPLRPQAPRREAGSLRPAPTSSLRPQNRGGVRPQGVRASPRGSLRAEAGARRPLRSDPTRMGDKPIRRPMQSEPVPPARGIRSQAPQPAERSTLRPRPTGNSDDRMGGWRNREAMRNQGHIDIRGSMNRGAYRPPARREGKDMDGGYQRSRGYRNNRDDDSTPPPRGRRFFNSKN